MTAREDVEAWERNEDLRWREQESRVEGGYCGCEYPRLWPPAVRALQGEA